MSIPENIEKILANEKVALEAYGRRLTYFDFAENPLRQGGRGKLNPSAEIWDTPLIYLISWLWRQIKALNGNFSG